MMKEGLLDRIKSRGYWRINFRPKAYEGETIPLLKCKEAVEKSSVQFRGWDYPHIPHRNDDNGSLLPCGEYYEAWTDWWNHIEFWRMYKSAQYLHYLALREDWLEASGWDEERAKEIPPLTSLGVSSTIYQITEIFEFASRLARLGLYKSGMSIDIRLENTRNRALWIDDPRRMPFSYPRQTGASMLQIKRELTVDMLVGGDNNSSLEALIELFEHFEWSPSKDLIASQQEQVRSGRF
jgi:hypothetical protein